MRQRFVLLTVVAAVVLVLDQLSKLWVSATMQVGDLQPVIDGFVRLRYTHNTGAAFGIFRDATGILSILSLVIITGIVVGFVRLGNPTTMSTIASGLVVGGALGNLVDRVRLGYVVDFVEVYGPHLEFNNTIYTFPVFNVGDSGITVGVILILIGLLFTREESKPQVVDSKAGAKTPCTRYDLCPVTYDAPPTVHTWQVEADGAGDRLDRAIAAHLSDLSRSYAAHLIEGGHVTVNGVARDKSSYSLKAGDTVTVSIPAPVPATLRAERIPLAVVYEDADLIVVDKPAGMVVHPAPGHSSGTLVNALLAHVPNLELDMGDEARPGIVHRLDKDTSGLLVVAKRRPAHEALTRQMTARTMHKEYIALVDGHPKPERGRD